MADVRSMDLQTVTQLSQPHAGCDTIAAMTVRLLTFGKSKQIRVLTATCKTLYQITGIAMSAFVLALQECIGPWAV